MYTMSSTATTVPESTEPSNRPRAKGIVPLFTILQKSEMVVVEPTIPSPVRTNPFTSKGSAAAAAEPGASHRPGSACPANSARPVASSACPVPRRAPSADSAAASCLWAAFRHRTERNGRHTTNTMATRSGKTSSAA